MVVPVPADWGVCYPSRTGFPASRYKIPLALALGRIFGIPAQHSHSGHSACPSNGCSIYDAFPSVMISSRTRNAPVFAEFMRAVEVIAETQQWRGNYFLHN